MDRYGEFRAVAAAFRFLAYGVAVVLGIGGVVALFVAPGPGAKLAGFVARALGAVVAYCLLLGASEASYALVDIAENSQKVAAWIEAQTGEKAGAPSAAQG